MKKTLFLGAFLFCVGGANAMNIQLNQPLPTVVVEEKGELVLVQDKIHYTPWHSNELAGKVRILQHMAGRTDVKAKNDALMTAIKSAHFDEKHYQTTNIINSNDSVFGTGFVVNNKAKTAKKENARSQVVLDTEGKVKEAWDLKPKESLIVVLDKKARVKFVYEGKLSEKQIQAIIQLARELQQ